MYCSESIPVVTDPDAVNMPCVATALNVGVNTRVEYIALKLSNSDASTLDEQLI